MLENFLNVIKPKYDPDITKRKEVIAFLDQRDKLSHEEWYKLYAKTKGISLPFVTWFRDLCSDTFEYDLKGALLDDKLVDDLGLYEATWSDVDMDIFEDFEDKFGKKITSESLGNIVTFGDLLELMWHQETKKG